jgi:hypothetical protein
MKITGASASSYEGLCFSIIPPPSWGLFPWGFSPVYSQSASSLHVRSSSLLACSLISVTIWAGIRRSRLALGKRPSFENPFRDATEVVHCFIGCWDAFVHQPIGCWDAFGHQPLRAQGHALRAQCCPHVQIASHGLVSHIHARDPHREIKAAFLTVAMRILLPRCVLRNYHSVCISN